MPFMLRLRQMLCKHQCPINWLKRTSDTRVECDRFKCGKTLSAPYGLVLPLCERREK